VNRPERLVYTHGGTKSGEQGVKFQVIVTFEDVGGKTRLTMRNIFDSAEDFQRVAKQYGAIDATAEEMATFKAGFGSMEKGFGGTLDQLEQYLAPEK
jgi:uncharacterized protein YndB with AHSA1/START domain